MHLDAASQLVEYSNLRNQSIKYKHKTLTLQHSLDAGRYEATLEKT